MPPRSHKDLLAYTKENVAEELAILHVNFSPKGSSRMSDQNAPQVTNTIPPDECPECHQPVNSAHNWAVDSSSIGRGKFIQQYIIAFLAARHLDTERAKQEYREKHGEDSTLNEEYSKMAYMQAVIAWDVVREIESM